MSKWLCRPGLGDEIIPSAFGICYIIDPFIVVGVDTEDIQNSLYSSFNESGWKDGEKLGITKDDIFSIKEYETRFDIFLNNKHIARFAKAWQYS